MKKCSTLRLNKHKKSYKAFLYCISAFIWIILWHIAAKFIDNEIFLPEPSEIFSVLFNKLLPSVEFWTSLLNSLLHIGVGFFCGAMTGIMLAVASASNEIIRAFLYFPVKIAKSIPVASFVILTLLWFDSEQLATVISAMIVFPILYINTLEGIRQTDEKLLEMAEVFRISFIRKIKYIYIPNALPYVLSACSLAVGMAWKSGIAAEIIGLVKNSIGNELYKAKLYLMTPELFAWTIVIVVLSIVCESIIKYFIDLVEKR